MINDNIVKGKWQELKGEVQKLWGNITHDELEETKGDTTKLGGLVQKKYGALQEDARHSLNKIIEKYGSSSEDDLNKTPKTPTV